MVDPKRPIWDNGNSDQESGYRHLREKNWLYSVIGFDKNTGLDLI